MRVDNDAKQVVTIDTRPACHLPGNDPLRLSVIHSGQDVERFLVAEQADLCSSARASAFQRIYLPKLA